MIDLDELERLHKAATPGEWEFDTEYDPDAAYGSGPDCDTGFKNYFIGATVPNGTEHGRWATLFDSVNSDHKLVEEEFDEDGKSSWDEIARANAASIVALHNAAPALIAAARERDALRSVLKWRPSRCNYDSLSAYDDAVRNWELQARAALKETSHDH